MVDHGHGHEFKRQLHGVNIGEVGEREKIM